MKLTIRQLEIQDIEPVAAAFQALGWNKPATQYERYYLQQLRGERVALMAFLETEFVGYLTICWQPSYIPFKQANIPEIQDFNVLPAFRKQGFGSTLMDEAKQLVASRATIIGIAVGLSADYGAAQRLYVRRGYIPDGQGLIYHHRTVKAWEQVTVDDDLVLCLTKSLIK